jgi:hypothetical protein
VTIRVIQWTTGPVGLVQLAEVIDHPGFDLVGLFVESGYGVVDKLADVTAPGFLPITG